MRMTKNKSKCYATNPKCLEGKERALLDGQRGLMDNQYHKPKLYIKSIEKKKKKIHKHTQPSRVCLVGGWKSMRLEKILVFLICVLLEVEN